MRTWQLFKSFSDKELKEIEERLASKKRKSLPSLFNAIKKHKGDTLPSKEILYKAAFGEDYTSKKDYLLRNELRHLNEEFYDFIAQKAFLSHINENKPVYHYYLASGLADRKLNEILEADIDDFIKQSQQTVKPKLLAALLDLKLLWNIQHQFKSPANIEAQKALENEYIAQEIRGLKYLIREHEARMAYLEYTRLIITNQLKDIPNNTITPPLETLDMSVEPNDWIENQLITKKHTFQTQGEVKLQVLKDILSRQEKLFAEKIGRFDAMIVSLNNIANELFLLRRPAEAAIYLADSLQRCIDHKRAPHIANIQNYILAQLILGNYEEGIRAYETYKKDIVGSRSEKAIAIYIAYIHLFLKEPDKALADLPSTNNVLDIHHFTARQVYAIAFYLRGDLELAQTECRNIQQMLRTKQANFKEEYLTINSLYNEFFRLVSIGSADTDKLKVLEERLIHLRAVEKLHGDIQMPISWLLKEVQEFSAQA
ncbi:MAG: hypothetical protein SFW35_02830 [Chitinophagales bacterium]|nr:hypothetical protein [Chitinophagales bacterium]